MTETATAPRADDAPTVADLLDAALREGLEEELPPEEADAWASTLRRTLEDAHPAVGAGAVGRVLEMLREALAVPIPDVLVSAWRRYEPFRKYVDPEAYPPDTESEVPLATHTARSTLTPQVDVLVGGAVVATLRFEVEVAMTLEGAAVRIRNGRFMGVRTGDCTVEAEVSFAGETLARVDPRPEELPGGISFGEGFLIDPFREDPYAPVPAGGGG